MSGKSDNLPPNQTVEPDNTPTSEEKPTGTMVRCHLTGEEISSDEAYWAPPLVTSGQLFNAISSNITRPGELKRVLMEEQPDVPYAPGAREELGRRRTAEQLKVLVLILVIVAIIVVPILLLVT